MQSYEYALNDEIKLCFETSPHVFFPTGTTRLLIESIEKLGLGPGSLLDLGCGIGVVGAVLHRLGVAQSPLFASDVSPEAVALTIMNCNENGVPVDARAGSVYAPWRGVKFDYIVDDVSGIAEAIGNLSSWFSGASCLSGKDGTDLVLEVIRAAPTHLHSNGKLFFPVLSLSNQRRIMSEAEKHFRHVKKLGRVEWPLPKDLQPHVAMLREMKQCGDIDYSEKFGMVIWTTEIFVASNDPGL
jgi:16S rRNA G1207 methylase RsmC